LLGAGADGMVQMGARGAPLRISMDWLFLLLALSGAWLTYNMYRPLVSSPRWAAFSFFTGWLWGELAVHMIVFQLAASAFFVWLVGLGTLPANLAVLVALTSCACLAYGFIGMKETAPAVTRALCDGLGADYEKDIRSDLRKHFAEGIRWKPILQPFPIRHPEVERISDIQFDRQKGINLKLDVYRHRSRPTNCPTLLQIHGGGWVIGDKREQGLPLMHQLAARGWVCVTANYRLSPHATFPEHLRDCKKALAWVKQHGAEYGANTDFVIVTGGSAGGHLAALVGLTENDPEYQPGFEEVDTSVRATVPVYGVYDFTDRHGFWNGGLAALLETKILKGSIDEIPDEYRKASPMDRVHSGVAPFCVIHGDNDSLVPVVEARTFVSMLRDKSREPVVYMEIPGAQHAFELFPSLRSQAVVDGIERFVAWTYSRYLDAREGTAATEGHDETGEPRDEPEPRPPHEPRPPQEPREAA
jgi:acetyl esterase/lipase